MIAEPLTEAADWRLLALLCERPRPGWETEVRALAAESNQPGLRDAAASAAGASEGEYLAYFGPGGPFSPREVAHRPMEDPGRILAGIAAYYDAFGYRPRGEDPADHVATEAGFMGYLALKEALATHAGDPEAAAIARDARRGFAVEHLSPLATGLARFAAAAPPHIAAAVAILASRAPAPAGRARAATGPTDPLARSADSTCASTRRLPVLGSASAGCCFDPDDGEIGIEDAGDW
jgi:hypothetical protein